MEQLNIAVQWAVSYLGTGLHIWLLGAALLYLLFSCRNHKIHRLFLCYTALFAVLYFCPLTVKVMGSCIGTGVYWRMLWLLPTPVIIAYAMAKSWERLKKTWQKAALLCAFCCLICLSGRNVYLQGGPFEQRQNWQKIPYLPAAVCSIIRGSLEENEEALLVSTWDVVGYVRQYDAGIGLIYGRRGRIPGFAELIGPINSGTADTHLLCLRTLQLGGNYIALPKDELDPEMMRKFGFEVVGEAENYYVWKAGNL